jgi:uracil-DNA glycosylase
MQLSALETEIKACRKCQSTLAKYNVEPRPIFSGGLGYPIFLLGQAPGRTEYKSNAPFQGDAGRSIRSLFQECGLRNFDGIVFQTSVTKCFPGRRAGSTTDRMPSVTEVNHCLPFLANQLKLVPPKLLVCLGGLAWKAFLSMREIEQPGFCLAEIGVRKPNAVTVPDVVGRQFMWRDAIVLPMIHPAGSANGARAAYPTHDIESKRLLRNALATVFA